MTSHSKIQSGVGTVLESEEVMINNPTLDKEVKTVYCLYRVSTKGQVDKNDIPMQKQACREFAARQRGWIIKKEFQDANADG